MPEPREILASGLSAMRADIKSLEHRLDSWIRAEMRGFFDKWGVPISHIDVPVSCYRQHGDLNKSSVLGEVKFHVDL